MKSALGVSLGVFAGFLGAVAALQSGWLTPAEAQAGPGGGAGAQGTTVLATGGGIAWDLALRGVRVILAEMGDLATGTSGRYHGLLHSGGRYVVRDAERRLLCLPQRRRHRPPGKGAADEASRGGGGRHHRRHQLRKIRRGFPALFLCSEPRGAGGGDGPHPALADAAEVETMGGLLTSLLGVVPAVGESATFSGLRFKAQVVDERRVHELEVEVVR